MAEKLNPFYKLLKAGASINITSEFTETFDSVNKALNNACDLELKQFRPGKQLDLMTVANSRSAGYFLMIEDSPQQKIQSKRKTYASVAFGSKIFSPALFITSMKSKEFLASYMLFAEIAHSLWEAAKPTIVSTSKKSVTRFVWTKFNTLSLWNACLTLKQHTPSVQSAQQLTFLPDRNLNLRRISVPNSGKAFRQHPLR